MNDQISMTPTNQKEAVLHYLQNTGPIDFLIAANVLGVSQLTARIAELRRDGWDFKKTTTKGRNRFGNSFVKTIYYNPRRA